MRVTVRIRSSETEMTERKKCQSDSKYTQPKSVLKVYFKDFKSTLHIDLLWKTFRKLDVIFPPSLYSTLYTLRKIVCTLFQMLKLENYRFFLHHVIPYIKPILARMEEGQKCPTPVTFFNPKIFLTFKNLSAFEQDFIFNTHT